MTTNPSDIIEQLRHEVEYLRGELNGSWVDDWRKRLPLHLIIHLTKLQRAMLGAIYREQSASYSRLRHLLPGGEDAPDVTIRGHICRLNARLRAALDIEGKPIVCRDGRYSLTDEARARLSECLAPETKGRP